MRPRAARSDPNDRPEQSYLAGIDVIALHEIVHDCLDRNVEVGSHQQFTAMRASLPP
jgi:hypothetical protein